MANRMLLNRKRREAAPEGGVAQLPAALNPKQADPQKNPDLTSENVFPRPKPAENSVSSPVEPKVSPPQKPGTQ